MKWWHRALMLPWSGGSGIAAPTNSVLPIISGTLAIGQTLTTTNGTWTGSPSFAYQWKRNAVNIGGATANTYVLTSSDPGTAITVTVTATNAGGSTPATSAAVNPSSLLTSLVAYYTLNEASGTRADSTGRGNDMSTIVGAPGNTTGKVSSAIQLTAASTQYISHASTTDLQGTADWTIAAWCWLDSVGTERSIVTKSTEWLLRYSTSANRFQVGWTDGIAAFRFTSADTLGIPSTATWYFVVGIHDSSSNLLKISVNNGTLDTSAATGVTTGAAVAAIGMRGTVNLWDGRIDELGIWQRVLSASEITTLYNAGNATTYPF